MAIEFILKVAPPMRRAVLLAAAHGMTDFGAPSLLLPYSVIALPLPGWLTTTAFGTASVFHFAADMGLGLSAALHAVLTAAALRNKHASFFAMSIYFCCVHTPMHYLRLVSASRVTAAAIALVITAAMALISAVPAWAARATSMLPKGARLLAPFSESPTGDGTGSAIHVTHMMQKLVVAHVIVEVLHGVSMGSAWLPSIGPPWQALAAIR